MTTIGPYVVLGTIGRGGMGTVLRARAPDGREVAVKLLRSVEGDRLARFERERRLQAALGEAEGFVPLLDVGNANQRPYLVMPLLPGGTLRARLARGPLPVEEAVVLVKTLARAVGRAHALGIVHRDLKPENVLFAADGRPLVADLGLAKHFDAQSPGASQSVSLSVHGAFRGTAGYAAPEQMASSREVGPPADVFALGAILHECLTGLPAFQGESLLDVFTKVAAGDPAPLGADVPAWLAAVVRRALAVDPADRFADGLALARALEPRAPPRRWPLVVGALLGVAGAGAILGTTVARPAPVAPPPASPPAVPVAPERTRTVGAAFAPDLARIIDEAHVRVASVLVEDARTGERLYERDPRRAMPPATALQLVTAAAAVHRLPDVELRTEVYLLQGGSIALVGGGDPSLSVESLERFAEAVAARTRQIEGDVVVDARRFDLDQRAHPKWPQVLPGDLIYLKAEVCALSVNDGCLDVLARAGAPVTVSPRIEALTVVPVELEKSRLTFDGKRWLARLGAPREGEIAWWVPIPRTELYAGHLFREALAAKGVVVTGGVRAVEGRDRRASRVAVSTTTVRELVAQVGRRSQGFHAECLLRNLGVEARGAGTFEAGASAVEEFARRECRVSPEELSVADGSGLASSSAASADALARVLRWAVAHPEFHETLNQLPAHRNRIRPGKTMGFLSPRLASFVEERGVVLKFQHGTIEDVTSFAGTIERADRLWAVVAILRSEAEPVPARRALEALIRRIVEETNP